MNGGIIIIEKIQHEFHCQHECVLRVKSDPTDNRPFLVPANQLNPPQAAALAFGIISHLITMTNDEVDAAILAKAKDLLEMYGEAINCPW